MPEINKTNYAWTVSNLKTNTVYTVKEVSVPDQSIYHRNELEYTFKISANGQLLTEDDQPFVSYNILFPNERKPVVGKATLVKKDNLGSLLADAEFTLYRLNEETDTYNPAWYNPETEQYEAMTDPANQSPAVQVYLIASLAAAMKFARPKYPRGMPAR